MRNNISLALLFVLVFILVSILSPMNISDDDQQTRFQTRFLPDYYIEGLRLVEFAEDGEPAAYIYAENVSGNHDTPDLLILSNPELIWHPSEQQHWNLRAKAADYDAESKKARLRGNVTVSGQKSASENRLTIEGQQLDIDFSAKIIQSESQVRVEYNANTMQAGALLANLANGHIQLTQGVDSSYTVNRAIIEDYPPRR